MKHWTWMLSLCVSFGLVACDDELVPDPEAGAHDQPATVAPAAEDRVAPDQAAANERAAVPEEADPGTPTLTASLGQAAPAFELTDQAGTSHTLAQYRGKIVVLEWINPDCPFVQRHYRAQTMRQLVETLPGDQVVWLAIDSSHFVTAESSQAWREEHDLPYPILLDADGATGRSYEATTTPNMYIVDAEGVLRYQGAIDDDPRGQNETPHNYVREAVQALLDGNAPPTPQTRPYGCSVKYEENT